MAEDTSILWKYRITKAPPSAYYIPDFITEEEENTLLRNIYLAPKPKWKQLNNRRLQNWGGLPHPKGMIPESLPQWLDMYATKIADLNVFEKKRPNHVLINEYLPGQGIMPHSDGPLFYPTISTINLGSHTLLHLYKPPSDQENVNSASLAERHFASLLLMPRSLLIIREDLYQLYHHGIDETTKDIITNDILNLEAFPSLHIGDELQRQNPRVSLTIRHVPKTLKFKLG